MIRLENKNYGKLIAPLRAVAINNLFARSVVENRVTGTVYVDDADDAKTFYVVHPYGMSLLFGDCDNQRFNAWFKDYALNRDRTRNSYEWMQAFPDNWDSVLSGLFRDCLVKSADNSANTEKNVIELNTRVNFKFNLNQYRDINIGDNADINIVRTDKRIFNEMKGSVVPAYFWNSAEDFYNNGIGFSLYYKNRLASTAYSSFIHDRQLELGIETVAEFRGLGLAQYSCSALINYCLENNYEPVWACRLENTGSYKLALKLGFEPVLTIPYYRLSK